MGPPFRHAIDWRRSSGARSTERTSCHHQNRCALLLSRVQRGLRIAAAHHSTLLAGDPLRSRGRLHEQYASAVWCSPWKRVFASVAASKWCALGSFIEVGIRSGACSWSGALREAGHRRPSGIAVKSVVGVLHILALHDGRLTQQPRRPSSTVGCPICSQL